MIDKIKNNSLLSHIAMFFILYIMTLTQDILFMMYVLLFKGIFYIDHISWFSALKTTFAIYIPLAILDISIKSYHASKKK